MELTPKQRHDILALCCAVAHADGNTSPLEFEHMLDLLMRIGQGSVGFEELQVWLEQGPPPLEAKLPEAHIKLFLHEAIAVANADGHVDESEISAIKRLIAGCFEGAEKYS